MLSVLTFDSIDEAIALANGTRYGLGASIWSNDLENVLYISKRLVAGNINVNGGTGPLVELPFGGFRNRASDATVRCTRSTSIPISRTLSSAPRADCRRGDFGQRCIALLISACRNCCRTASASSGVQCLNPLPFFMPRSPLSMSASR